MHRPLARRAGGRPAHKRTHPKARVTEAPAVNTLRYELFARATLSYLDGVEVSHGRDLIPVLDTDMIRNEQRVLDPPPMKASRACDEQPFLRVRVMCMRSTLAFLRARDVTRISLRARVTCRRLCARVCRESRQLNSPGERENVFINFEDAEAAPERRTC